VRESGYLSGSRFETASKMSTCDFCLDRDGLGLGLDGVSANALILRICSLGIRVGVV
jgi:hypothetical protein